MFFDTMFHEAVHEFIGIASAENDFHSAVSALETGKAELVCFVTGRNRDRGIFHCNIGIESAGATNIHFAFVFAVEVDQDIAFQHIAFKSESTGHSGFLVNGHQCLDRAVFDGFRSQYSHGCGNTHSIVSAECGAVSSNPFTIDICLDGIFFKIKILVAVFLRNHVEVTLQHNALAVFHTRGCRLADDHIAHFVNNGFKTK
ncbi:hypothetical protein SDC9_89213 [bioreactor metagenome]|uniref:Uncharacterized protein n=1 Tax=bioreactor metagenome TaxID=1076179 RepID=A0A644ZP80_9ZZZZ